MNFKNKYFKITAIFTKNIVYLSEFNTHTAVRWEILT